MIIEKIKDNSRIEMLEKDVLLRIKMSDIEFLHYKQIPELKQSLCDNILKEIIKSEDK